VPAKHANIYNLPEINNNSYKDLIMKNTLNNKKIMMLEEGQSVNVCNKINIKQFMNVFATENVDPKI
jgi:hypothetical protein